MRLKASIGHRATDTPLPRIPGFAKGSGRQSEKPLDGRLAAGAGRNLEPARRTMHSKRERIERAALGLASGEISNRPQWLVRSQLQRDPAVDRRNADAARAERVPLGHPSPEVFLRQRAGRTNHAHGSVEIRGGWDDS